MSTFEDAYEGVHSSENIRAYCESNYSVREVEKVLQANNVACYIAYREGKTAGFYLLKHHSSPIPLAGASFELKQIYVLSSEYGSGTGRLLFDDATRCGKEAGSSWMWLVVSDLNYRAQSFYRKLGFQSPGAGPELIVGTDCLPSTILALKL